jgi:asparaginyl-tRNA synthetase
MFIVLNDGTSSKDIQLVAKSTLADFEGLSEARTGASILAIGNVVLTPERPQPFEIQLSSGRVLKNSDEDYPLQKKEHSNEFLREIAHLRARTTKFNAIFKIRSELSFAIHDFFKKNSFVYAHTPIISSLDSEGAGETFDVSVNGETFFDKKASLTVSGQLNAESMAQAFKRVYTFGPTFRAEKSYTNRHAAEF